MNIYVFEKQEIFVNLTNYEIFPNYGGTGRWGKSRTLGLKSLGQ
jgi:hypothetical protein